MIFPAGQSTADKNGPIKREYNKRLPHNHETAPKYSVIKQVGCLSLPFQADIDRNLVLI